MQVDAPIKSQERDRGQGTRDRVAETAYGLGKRG